MREPPERSAERDAAIDAMLPRVAEQGWTFAALRGGLADAGSDPLDAPLLFPGGASDMVEAFCDLADRRMEQAARAEGLDALPVSRRIRALIALRLRQADPWRDAIRRALALMTLPRHAAMTARTLARTIDTMWHVAGDRAADFNWYSKRALLAGVYGTALLYWLRDYSPEQEDTLAFLDRRLAGVARIGRLRARLPGLRKPGPAASVAAP